MTTAGRAVVFSGTAVAIGLALLLFMPLPFMRGFGIGGLIIPTVSVIAALTFLPVVLSLAGRAPRAGAPAAEDADGSPRRPRARLLGAAGALDHAPPLARRDLHDGLPAPPRRTGLRPAARPGLERGHSQEPRGGAGARHPHGGGRRRCHRADRRRRRHGERGWRRGCRRRGGGRAPAHRPRGRPAGRARRLRRRRPAARRRDRPLPERPGDRQERLRQAGEPRLRRPAAARDRARRRASPTAARVYAGGGPPGGKDFLAPHLQLVPVARRRSADRHVRAARAGIPLAAPAAQGDHPQLPLDRRRLRPARRGLQVGVGRAVRADLVRPDRGMDPGDALRDAVRSLDGLRGLPRQPDARGVG